MPPPAPSCGPTGCGRRCGGGSHRELPRPPGDGRPPAGPAPKGRAQIRPQAGPAVNYQRRIFAGHRTDPPRPRSGAQNSWSEWGSHPWLASSRPESATWHHAHVPDHGSRPRPRPRPRPTTTTTVTVTVTAHGSRLTFPPHLRRSRTLLPGRDSWTWTVDRVTWTVTVTVTVTVGSAIPAVSGCQRVSRHFRTGTKLS